LRKKEQRGRFCCGPGPAALAFFFSASRICGVLPQRHQANTCQSPPNGIDDDDDDDYFTQPVLAAWATVINFKSFCWLARGVRTLFFLRVGRSSREDETVTIKSFFWFTVSYQQFGGYEGVFYSFRLFVSNRQVSWW
jgi:hypothetical protein